MSFGSLHYLCLFGCDGFFDLPIMVQSFENVCEIIKVAEGLKE